MKRVWGCALLLAGLAVSELTAQGLSATSLASPAKPTAKPAAKPAQSPTGKKPKKEPKAKDDGDDPLKKAVGGGSNLPKDQPIITEIYADEAFFDSANHFGIFTGHVIVNDPRFNVQSDKLTLYLSKAPPPAEGDAPASPAPDQGLPNQTLEKAVAEGNVGVVRDRPGENGQPPTRSVGRSDMATYTTSDGRVELRGTPRVQSGMNTHVATSPDTVMVLENDGQLTTKGPSRTEIRQAPKTEQSPGAPAAPPAATPAPKKP